MQGPIKYCPRCKTPAALAAPACASCGRQYRTQYADPADQTILGDPSSIVPPGAPPGVPPGVPPAPPTYHATAALGGPLDDTERNVSMAWTGIGGVLAGVLCIAAVDTFMRQVLWMQQRDAAVPTSPLPGILPMAAPPASPEPAIYALIGVGLMGWLFSFLLMRFRRLYLAAPSGASLDDIHRRRAQFSLIASLAIAAVIGFGVVAAGTELYQDHQRTIRIAAAEAEAKRQRLAAEAEARQREARQEAERSEERQAELDLAKRRLEIEAENDRRARADAPAIPPAIPHFYNGMGSGGSSRYGVGGSSLPASSNPNVLPCGHPFLRFQGAGGTAVCSLGHTYRINGGRWVPAR